MSDNAAWLEELIRRVRKLNSTDLREMWPVLTALRGPDNGNDLLKDLTTMRIRSILGLENGLFGALVKHKPLTDSQVIQRNNLLNTGDRHFANHIEHAYECLQQLGYSVPLNEMDFEKQRHYNE